MLTFEELIEVGVFYQIIDEHGEYVTKDGENTYGLDLDKAKIYAPEIYAQHESAMYSAMLEAAELGWVEFDFDYDKKEVVLVATEKGLKELE